MLIGTPDYQSADLPDIPQVRANIADLARVLTDPRGGGFPQEHVAIAAERERLPEIGVLLNEAAARAEDLLLFYFAGHGLLGRRGALYLGLHSSSPAQPAYDSLPFETVRETFLDGPALNKVLIIDSCYSGRAIGTMAGDKTQTGLGQLEISGTFILAAAPANRPALVRQEERHTAFTGRLLELLEQGPSRSGRC